MTDIQPKHPIQFSGYQRDASGRQARVFVPGHGDAKSVEADILAPGGRQVKTIPLTRADGDYWKSDNLAAGTWYLPRIDGQSQLDQVETGEALPGKTMNRLSAYESQSPTASVSLADMYLDSAAGPSRLAGLKAANDGRMPMRNHFNLFGPNETDLNELLPQLRKTGFSALLLKPFIGGDNLSSHRYWTTDPYILNNSFSSKAAFRQFLVSMMANDMKLFADGAFVNQGLNGVQKLSNLAHNMNSPYWQWFSENEAPEGQGPTRFPKHAFEKDNWAVLPTIRDEHDRPTRVAYERFALRVVNDPQKPGYDPRDWTFIQSYDPNTQTADGKPLKPPYEITASGDSVQNLMVPVKLDELKAKRHLLYKPASEFNETDRAQLLEWDGMRFTADFKDDSGFKWDGQVDVPKLNMRNPEVVSYVQGAMRYWTLLAKETYTDAVAQALGHAAKSLGVDSSPDSAAALIQAITQKPGEDPAQALREGRVLPPLAYADAHGLTPKEAAKAMAGAEPRPESETAHDLARRVTHDYPLSALELPPMFKATLSYPRLEKVMRADSQSPLRRMIAHTLLPLTGIPVLGEGIATLLDIFAPVAFDTQLTRKLEKALNTLRLQNPQAAAKLRDPGMQAVLTEKLAERIYMQIFTGLDDAGKATPVEIRKKFLDTIPGDIYKGDPERAAGKLPRFMRRRLAKVSDAALARFLENEANGLDPKLVALAGSIVEKRELGLNWRLDAAKDVSNMDVVKNAAMAERPEVFLKEIDFVKKFWDGLGHIIHQVFPKATIIGELTDFHPYSGKNDAAVQKALQTLFKDNTFNGMVNWEFTYHPLHRLLYFDQRPDEGGSAITPSTFLDSMTRMHRSLPFPVLRQMQNISSCHDQITSSHGLLVNPLIYAQDLIPYWGLVDDLHEAVNELKSKTCFVDTRQAMGIENLDGVLDKLNELAAKPEVRGKLSADVQTYFDETSKLQSVTDEHGQNVEPPRNPATLKPQFMEELFAAVTPAQLGISAEQHEKLKAALTARMAEPSEARATRAVIVNNVPRFNWESLPENFRLDAEQQAQFQRGVFKAIDKTITQHGRHFGERPLDIALDNVFDNLNASLPEGLPDFVKTREFQAAFKAKFHDQANAPVMDRLLRMFAVQTAMPGNPSIYLQDLFARGGAEWQKNIFVQDRNLLPVDQIDNNPAFRQYFDKAGEIISARSTLMQKYPGLRALNDGAMLPVLPADMPPKPEEWKKDSEPDYAKKLAAFEAADKITGYERIQKNIDDSGVMPIVRDNGHDQVIALINTGRPEDHSGDYKNRVGTGSEYTEIKNRTEGPVRNHKPDLAALKLAPGTQYEDVHNGEIYQLNDQGQLVDVRQPEQGIDVDICRFLVRREAPKPPA